MFSIEASEGSFDLALKYGLAEAAIMKNAHELPDESWNTWGNPAACACSAQAQLWWEKFCE